VIAASPDRIALYSYAHVPHLFKPQRRIDVDAMPAPETKLAILALAIEKLGAAGYLYIGMDHFAKPGEELAVAQAQKKLHRNFQGYSTKPDCDMLAFGISAIGKVGAAYVANVKTLDEYYERLDGGTLPVMRGVELSADDLIRRDVIQKLMCNFELDFAALGAQFGIAFADYFAPDLAALGPLAADGLLVLTDRDLKVTMRGRLLVRTVAMHFDRYLREAQQKAQYSRVI
jgi:oxygen-independent coproporphyrinogen-3 oxidase